MTNNPELIDRAFIERLRYSTDPVFVTTRVTTSLLNSPDETNRHETIQILHTTISANLALEFFEVMVGDPSTGEETTDDVFKAHCSLPVDGEPATIRFPFTPMLIGYLENSVSMEFEGEDLILLLWERFAREYEKRIERRERWRNQLDVPR